MLRTFRTRSLIFLDLKPQKVNRSQKLGAIDHKKILNLGISFGYYRLLPGVFMLEVSAEEVEVIHLGHLGIVAWSCRDNRPTCISNDFKWTGVFKRSIIFAS